jgi:branched-chain amino acid aminotransferase
LPIGLSPHAAGRLLIEANHLCLPIDDMHCAKTIEERLVWMTGHLVPWHQAKVHMLCHSFARGSTIFEVIGFHATPQGPVVFRLHDHVRRLLRSAELLDLALPCDHEALCRAVVETVRGNGLQEGLIKIVGYFPQIALGIQPPQAPLDLAVFALNPDRDLPGPRFSFAKGTTAGIARWRKLDPQTVPVEAKAAANYLNGMIARLDVQKRGLEEAILLDTHGFLAEGATESVFLVKGGKLMTPTLGTVLDGITRRSILQAAAHLGLETSECLLPPELLFEAEEIFFGNTPCKIMPVRRVEDREIAAVPGPVQTRLAEFFRRMTAGQETQFKDWLYPVT